MSPPDAGWPRATVNERLLIHLREAWIGQSGPPQASTQEGIARALRIRSNHVSRAVAMLVRGGLVAQSTERVRGELRKRKVYALTAQGRALADRLHAELCKKEVLLLSAGSESRLLVGEALRLPGGPFTLTQVLTALRDGHVLAPTALRSPEPVAAWVRVEAGIPAAEKVLGRRTEAAELDRWFASPVPALLLVGPKGIGKSALAADCARRWSASRHSFWHTVAATDPRQTLEASFARFLEQLGPAGSRAAKGPVPLGAELLRRLAGRPAVLVIDGLSEADGGVRDMAVALVDAAAAAGAKVLLLSNAPLPLAAELRARGLLQEMTLRGLAAEDARALAGSVPEEQFQRLYRLAQGNPLALKLAVLSWKEATPEGLSDSERTLLSYLRATKG